MFNFLKKHAVAVTIAFFGLGLGGVIAAVTVRTETVRWDFVNGIRAASVTDLSGNTLVGAGANGETITNGTDGQFTLTRDESGTVTVTAADDDSTAALTIKPGGAAAFVLGGTSTTAITLTTDSTGNAEVVLPTGSVGSTEVGMGFVQVVFCGQNDENGTIYFAPTPLTSARPALADATCDGNDNATETTADAPVVVSYTLTPKFMTCITNATLGTGESMVLTLDAATVATAMTCTIGEAATTCEFASATASQIAANTALALKAVETSNNSDDDTFCVVTFAVN